jgi:cytochrome c5
MDNKIQFLKPMALSALVAFFAACGGGEGNDEADAAESSDPVSYTEEAKKSDEPNRGIGPIKHIELTAIDDDLALEGEETFNKMCTACHKMDERHVGPPMAGVTERRTPEWIMNMILNPDEMTKKDPDAYALIAEYIAPMANQSLTEEQTRAILEYFRKYDNK